MGFKFESDQLYKKFAEHEILMQFINEDINRLTETYFSSDVIRILVNAENDENFSFDVQFFDEDISICYSTDTEDSTIVIPLGIIEDFETVEDFNNYFEELKKVRELELKKEFEMEIGEKYKKYIELKKELRDYYGTEFELK